MSTRSGPPPRGGRRRSDRRLLQQAAWLVAALAVIGTSLFAGSLVFGDDGVSDSQPTPSITPMTSAPPSPSASASSTPSPSTTPTATATRAGMTDFVDSYLAAVAKDPAIAWDKLTPGFQRTSGGFSDYRAFWAPITAARASNVDADPGAGTVSYDVTYTYADGHTTKDSTRLTLRYAGGGYRISGEG